MIGFPTSEEKTKYMKRTLAWERQEGQKRMDILNFRQEALYRQLEGYAGTLRTKKSMMFEEEKVKSMAKQIVQLKTQKKMVEQWLNGIMAMEIRIQTSQLNHSSINSLRELASITASQYGNADAILKLEKKLEGAKLTDELIGDTVASEFPSEAVIDSEASTLSDQLIAEYFFPQPPTGPVRERVAVPIKTRRKKSATENGDPKPPPPSVPPPGIPMPNVPAPPLKVQAEEEEEKEEETEEARLLADEQVL